MKSRLAILASGGGTTAEAFVLASLNNEIDTELCLVICNRRDAGIFERIAQLNKKYNLSIKCILINSATHPAKEGEKSLPGTQTVAEEAAIITQLKESDFDSIALLGYMKRVGPQLVKAFGWRTEYSSVYQAKMVNTHPGLLPETKGLYGTYVQQHVLDMHLPTAGQTLHVVAEDYDEGPVIAEHQVAVQPGDNAESLFDRVREMERLWLPRDIDTFIKERQNYISANTKE